MPTTPFSFWPPGTRRRPTFNFLPAPYCPHLWRGQVPAQVGVHAVAHDGEVRAGGALGALRRARRLVAVHHARHHLPLLPLGALVWGGVKWGGSGHEERVWRYEGMETDD